MSPLHESINNIGLDTPNTNSLNAFEKLAAKGSPLSASACDGIWLLDDDVSMLKALGRLMNSAGFIVEKFNRPAAFLARLEHAPCRVAVLDVWDASTERFGSAGVSPPTFARDTDYLH